jgi:hypothetical protein|tara:strand:+ start:734 stop:967 length:234 start_codon:yes stop_codon:yes gene_type:complete
MEVDAYFIWDALITIFVIPICYFLRMLYLEIQRVQILLNQTREDYIKRSEHSEVTQNIFTAISRLEDKIDRLIERGT